MKKRPTRLVESNPWVAPRTLDVSIVIPVYRSGEFLAELLRQVSDVLGERQVTHEVILVDDASPDDTWSVIQALVQEFDQVRAVRLMRNRGQAAATLCGLEMVRGSFVITMDDDLQHPPDQIPILLDALEADPTLDGVFGAFEVKHHSLSQNLGSRFLAWVNSRAFGLPKDLRSSSFRALRREVADAAVEHRTGTPALTAIIYSSTSRLTSVPVRHQERRSGTSGYTFGRQMRLAWDNICHVSMLPLRLVSLVGFIVCGFSVLMVGHTLFNYYTGRVGVAGWTTVVILVSFFSGVTLLALGVMGEYLVRVLREVRGTPRFIIRDQAFSPLSKD